ncbi:Ran BP2/NZF zinc finger-like superfamily protein [Striga asiatica]|uniref:Ran BP2/NZF zinc finger-like superfamily protein n=1 Tax=Striga asiatica TaxID=4170 RepID=A0A5A7R8C8_STRAF|nr:Ran BP2/NZF zinc finger-like superfamily protein [Striga asiatica]
MYEALVSFVNRPAAPSPGWLRIPITGNMVVSGWAAVGRAPAKPFLNRPNPRQRRRRRPRSAEPQLSQFFRNAISTADDGTKAIDTEAAHPKQKLRELEKVVRSLSKERDENGRKTRPPIPAKTEPIERDGAQVSSLSALFAVEKKEKVKSNKLPIVFGLEDPNKELSPEDLNGANFLPKDEFHVTCFEMSYDQEFLKSAAVKFGEDHQKIAVWLTASDLKKIALFGCPSYGHKSIYAAKHMRQFFEIEEQKAKTQKKKSFISFITQLQDELFHIQVCGTCTLRNSCKHANKGWNKSTQLSLAKVIQVLVMYAMGSVPENLEVPEDKQLSESIAEGDC